MVGKITAAKSQSGDFRNFIKAESIELESQELPKASSINTNAAPGNRTFPNHSFGLSGKEAAILNNADYAFTGSYYNVHRNIMSFDPLDLLPHFRGNHPIHNLHNLLLHSNDFAILLDQS